MSRKRIFENDTDRISSIIDTFPTYKFSPATADAFLESVSNKTLAHICNRIFPKHGFLERSELVALLADVSNARLAKTCQEVGIETQGLERAELVKLLKQRPDPEACPICLECFEPADFVVVMLCNHQFHHSCAKEAACMQFEATGKKPTCPVCRECIFHTPGTKRRRESQGLE